MKYFFTLFTTCLLIQSASARDAIVIVLEAPLLREPSLSSTVVQTIRKGQRVYIPNEYITDGTVPEFVPTFDRTGNRAYIPGRYVKLILGTVAENNQPITLPHHDPTDYRLEEPIPATYPFEESAYIRSSISFLVGNSTKSPYAYNSAFDNQNYGVEMGGRFTFTKRVAHDTTDRFYFGVIGFISSSKNTIDFKNNNSATESRGVYRAGPWITYDAYKSDKYRLTLGTGFTFNYHRTTLMVDSTLLGEERLFSGFSFSPMTSSTFQISNILPNTDFISGVDLSFFLPYTLKTDSEAELQSLWGDDNQIKSGFKPQASLFVGVQVKY